jgi:hypothetical protein
MVGAARYAARSAEGEAVSARAIYAPGERVRWRGGVYVVEFAYRLSEQGRVWYRLVGASHDAEDHELEPAGQPFEEI